MDTDSSTTPDIASRELPPVADETTEDTRADELRAKYPAVTQFKGRAVRYVPPSPGQMIALQSIGRDDENHFTGDSIELILAVLEGCIGPDQWKRVRLDLATRKLEAQDPIQLFLKILDKAKRDADKTAAVPPK